ncbi:MAG: hypothetical protein Q8936_19380 [Bacillota bacterium]|nr:hypothetical protein [Bacillota bacterium]
MKDIYNSALYRYLSSSNLNLLMKINQIRKNQTLTFDEIKNLQEKQLKKLLEYVLTHSIFYKNYYASNGITLDKVHKVSFEDLPIIDKEIIMENYDDVVCDKNLKRVDLEKFLDDPGNVTKKYKDYYEVIHTSGSSGTLGIFAYNAEEWNVLRALGIARTSKLKLKPFRKIKFVFVGATDGRYAGISLIRGVPPLFTKLLTININSPIDHIVEQVNNYQPDVLSGYASGNFMLAQEQLKGNLNIKPSKIICSADLLTDYMRETIKDAFKINPINMYAASESIGMASECEAYHNLHLFTDLYKFEVVDKDLKPVPPGGSGNLILTNLFNYTEPIIRYKMNDEIIIDDTTCKCGWPFPILKNISGRQEDFLWFEKSDGTKEYIHPLTLAVFFVEGLIKFRFIQTSTNSLLMKAVVHGNKSSISSAIYNKINEILTEKRLNTEVSFELEIVERLANDSRTGKFKLIIPFKNLPNTASDEGK